MIVDQCPERKQITRAINDAGVGPGEFLRRDVKMVAMGQHGPHDVVMRGKGKLSILLLYLINETAIAESVNGAAHLLLSGEHTRLPEQFFGDSGWARKTC